MGKILWLASYPRSGNTWLRAFLHNLLRDPPEPYDINRLQDFTLIDSQARWYRPLDPRPCNELTKDEVAALRPLVHAAMTRAFPDTVFVKTHNAVAALNRPGNQSVGNQPSFVYERHGSWSEHVGSWTALSGPALHVVRYED